MKTVVFGLFENTDDALRVLHQIVDSPLDLDTVSVLNADAALQDRLHREAGLPRRRSLGPGIGVGGLIGVAVGALIGSTFAVQLGPLLSAGLGALAGAVLGAVAVVASESNRLPPELADDVLAALESGATLVSVRTSSMPTAVALRDLFAAGGSRLLEQEPAGSSSASALSAAYGPPADPRSGASGVLAGGTPQADDHDLFAPPWRRTPFAARPRAGLPVDDAPSSREVTGAHQPVTEPLPSVSIESLGMPVRVARALAAAGVLTYADLQDLASSGDEALLAVPGIGPQSLEDLRVALSEQGASPSPSTPAPSDHASITPEAPAARPIDA
jgi:hypothetical protein